MRAELRRRMCLALLWAAACGDDGSKGDAGVGTPPPPITTGPAATSTSGGPGTGVASSTGADSGCGCAAGTFCAAPHVGGVTDPSDDRLVYACQAACIPAGDPTQWCSADEPSCCDGLPCTETGFCGDNGLGTATGIASSSSGDGSGTDASTSSGTTDATGSGTTDTGATSSTSTG